MNTYAYYARDFRRADDPFLVPKFEIVKIIQFRQVLQKGEKKSFLKLCPYALSWRKSENFLK